MLSRLGRAQWGSVMLSWAQSGSVSSTGLVPFAPELLTFTRWGNCAVVPFQVGGGDRVEGV